MSKVSVTLCRIGALYEDLSQRFLDSTDFVDFLQAKLACFATRTPNTSSVARKLTLCGFSLGAGVAFALAHKIKLMAPALDIRVVGFGPTKIGSRAFSQWCHKNLDVDSLSVILASSDVVVPKGRSPFTSCQTTPPIAFCKTKEAPPGS